VKGERFLGQEHCFQGEEWEEKIIHDRDSMTARL